MCKMIWTNGNATGQNVQQLGSNEGIHSHAKLVTMLYATIAYRSMAPRSR